MSGSDQPLVDLQTQVYLTTTKFCLVHLAQSVVLFSSLYLPTNLLLLAKYILIVTTITVLQKYAQLPVSFKHNFFYHNRFYLATWHSDNVIRR